MRLAVTIGLVLAFAHAADAQHNAGFAHPLPSIGGSIKAPVSCTPRLVHRHVPTGVGARDRFGEIVIPYAVPYPIYPGYREDEDPAYIPSADQPNSGYQQQPTMSTGISAPYSPATPAIINQFLPDIVQSPLPQGLAIRSSQEDSEEIISGSPGLDGSEQPAFFIGLKDGTVYAAASYWLDGETIHYITVHGIHNLVSISLIDRKISLRLNGIDILANSGAP
jgi:hypothetical protein